VAQEKSMKKEKSRLLQAARRVRDEIYSAVKTELMDDSKTYQTIAESHGISTATVQRIATSLGISRQVGPRPQERSQEVANGNVRK
jgi:hypothetical protein